MDTSRDDIGIAIRSAFIQKGSKQRFSLLALILISVILIFFETMDEAGNLKPIGGDPMKSIAKLEPEGKIKFDTK